MNLFPEDLRLAYKESREPGVIKAQVDRIAAFVKKQRAQAVGSGVTVSSDLKAASQARTVGKRAGPPAATLKKSPQKSPGRTPKASPKKSPSKSPARASAASAKRHASPGSARSSRLRAQ